MEAAMLAPFLNTILPKLWKVINERDGLRKCLEGDIASIQRNLRMIAALIEDHQSSGEGMNGIRREWIKQARGLAQDIEDCIDHFLHPVSRESVCAKEFAREIDQLLRRSQLLKPYDACSSTSAAFGSTMKMSCSTTAHEDQHIPQSDVSMDEPLNELMDLVRESERLQERKLRVVSIVGFGGLGKTLRAKQIYTSEVGRQFRSRAWVRAAEKDPGEIIKEILKQVVENTATTSTDVHHVHNGATTYTDVERLISCLRKRRYLIVIDDVRTTEQWHTVKYAFPDEKEVSSRIIVTTTIQSVANTCSFSNGYVYKLPPLNKDRSEDLFFKEVPMEDRFMKGKAAEILKKCDGLPLALVSVSQFLQGYGPNGGLTEEACEDACRKLGAYLEEEGGGLARMQRVLASKYTGLSGHVLKACLLYFCMFPCDHPTRRSSLIRRWLAEGFVEAKPRCSLQDVAADNLKTLIDRSIVQSMEVSANGNVKRCRPPGMMLEYISYKSMSEDFAVFVSDEAPAAKRIRRLSLHHVSDADDGWISGVDLSRVRTLAVSGNVCQATLNFDKYELLRVLDLKECAYLHKEHLRKICDLLLLKYLSLGDSIGEVPSKIAKLKLLETLDMRRTETVMVPAEVILLPSLAHLIGKFQLFRHAYERDTEKLEKFLSKDSNLERFSGFVIGKSKGFQQLMLHMRRLRKVKIWCGSISTGDEANLTHVSEAIKKFIREGKDMARGDRSLSIDSTGCSVMPFENSEYPGRLTSLKLKGKLKQFPRFVTQLGGIEKLCLSSTGLPGVLIVDGLSKLLHLRYLKLHEDDLRGLDAKDKQFPSLRLVCFSVKSHLPRPEIIGNFGYLKEVYLYSDENEHTRCSWTEAAKRHPKRPIVWFGPSCHQASL
ncbi:hypothetical protein ACQJBY_048091 [Aegilops geniculata]